MIMGQRIFSLCGNSHVYLKPLRPVLVLLHPSYLVFASWQLPNIYRIHCSVAGAVFFARYFICETSLRDQDWSHMGKRNKTSTLTQCCWFWAFVGLFFHPFAITSTPKGLNWWELYCNEKLSVVVVSAANVSWWAAVRLRFSFSKG